MVKSIFGCEINIWSFVVQETKPGNPAGQSWARRRVRSFGFPRRRGFLVECHNICHGRHHGKHDGGGDDGDDDDDDDDDGDDDDLWE